MIRRVAAAALFAVMAGLLVLGAAHRTDSVLAREAGASGKVGTVTTAPDAIRDGDGLHGGLGSRKGSSGHGNGGGPGGRGSGTGGS